MNYLSVCSGIEAASVAWHPLGWNPIAFSEIEKFPAQLLAHHYPQTPNWGDMTKFKEWPDADVNVLVGGTPCQSFSVAGLRKGLDDPRGNLMLTYLAIADRYRPEWVVWENVPGVLSSNGGRDFASFLRGLAELGYGFAYRILDAQYFGVAQRRRRVFVVGHIGDWQRAAAVLFERHSLQGHPAPRREAGKRVAGTIEASLGRSRGAGTPPGAIQLQPVKQREVAGCLNSAGGHAVPGNSIQDVDQGYLQVVAPPPNISRTLNAGGMGRQDWETETLIPTNGGGFDVAHSLRGEGFDASEDGTGRGTPLMPIAFSAKDYGADAGELAPTLRAGDHTNSHANAGVMPTVAFGVGEAPDVGHCLRSGASKADKHESTTYIQSSMQVRRLTPRECERLQGFPDDYTLVQHRNKPAADGPRYKALGNSMAVPVMAWIGERIKQVEGL